MNLKRLKIGDVKRANIPRRFWDVKLGEIPDKFSYKDDVKKYIKKMNDMIDKGVGLYLWSEMNSTGKTSLAVIILKYALRMKYTGFFEESGMLKESLIEGEEFDDLYSVKERIHSVDLLVIDDIGKEYRTKSGFAENQLEKILRYRTQSLKTTIFTGNVEPKQLRDIYSEDFKELLVETMIPIEVSGMNWRHRNQQQLRNLL